MFQNELSVYCRCFSSGRNRGDTRCGDTEKLEEVLVLAGDSRLHSQVTKKAFSAITGTFPVGKVEGEPSEW